MSELTTEKVLDDAITYWKYHQEQASRMQSPMAKRQVERDADRVAIFENLKTVSIENAALREEVERLKEVIAIGTKDNPDFGDYEKSAGNLAEGFMEQVGKVSYLNNELIKCNSIIQDQQQQLSRYENAVEVEGFIRVDENEVLIVTDVHEWPIGHGFDIGQRVRVLVTAIEPIALPEGGGE